MKKRMLFDLDESLVDQIGQLVRDLEALRAPSEPEITTENIFTCDKMPHIAARVKMIRQQPGWWANLPPIVEGMKVFQAAKELGFECVVLSCAPKLHDAAWTEKNLWCRRHLGSEVPVFIITGPGNKEIASGDVLYDDYPPYGTAWLQANPNGLVIRPVTPHNHSVSDGPGVVLYNNNLDEIIARLTA